MRTYGGGDPTAGGKDSADRAASGMLSDTTGSTSYPVEKGYHDENHPNIWLYHKAIEQSRDWKLESYACPLKCGKVGLDNAYDMLQHIRAVHFNFDNTHMGIIWLWTAK